MSSSAMKPMVCNSVSPSKERTDGQWVLACFTGDGNKESLYGAAIWGPVAKNLDINLAYAKSSLDKGEINNSGNIDYYYADSNDKYKIKPKYGYGEKNLRSYGYVLSMATNINKDLRFIADYAKTDADFQNNSIALRLNYKDADYKKPGSYGLYLRYIKYGENGWLAGDDEWNSTWYGTKGWIAGVRYAPWKTLSGKRCIPNRNATGVRRMNMTVISSGLNWISISKI